jgi:transcriptional regulator GlxA family with amidase domain
MTKSARESGEGKRGKDERQATRLAFVLLPRFNMMALMAAIEPLRVANYLSGRTLYDWRYLSPEGGAAIASNGLSVETLPLAQEEGPWSCVFVCASWNAEQYENKKLFSWLRRLDRLGVSLGAMDLGLYVLARAGLLNGYRAAVLWYCIRAFREAYPEVQAEECLFLTDRRRTTIAGGTAGLDAMLNDIARRHGERLAHEVADHILHHPQRKATSPQRSAMGGAPCIRSCGLQFTPWRRTRKRRSPFRRSPAMQAFRNASWSGFSSGTWIARPSPITGRYGCSTRGYF